MPSPIADAMPTMRNSCACEVSLFLVARICLGQCGLLARDAQNETSGVAIFAHCGFPGVAWFFLCLSERINLFFIFIHFLLATRIRDG
jgi:hypothetical protein